MADSTINKVNNDAMIETSKLIEDIDDIDCNGDVIVIIIIIIVVFVVFVVSVANNNTNKKNGTQWSEPARRNTIMIKPNCFVSIASCSADFFHRRMTETAIAKI